MAFQHRFTHINGWIQNSQWRGLWGGQTSEGQDSIFTPVQGFGLRAPATLSLPYTSCGQRQRYVCIQPPYMQYYTVETTLEFCSHHLCLHRVKEWRSILCLAFNMDSFTPQKRMWAKYFTSVADFRKLGPVGGVIKRCISARSFISMKQYRLITLKKPLIFAPLSHSENQDHLRELVCLLHSVPLVTCLHRKQFQFMVKSRDEQERLQQDARKEVFSKCCVVEERSTLIKHPHHICVLRRLVAIIVSAVQKIHRSHSVWEFFFSQERDCVFLLNYSTSLLLHFKEEIPPTNLNVQ